MNLRACQVSLHSMDSTSVYGLELLVLEGTGGKALATDHRGLNVLKDQQSRELRRIRTCPAVYLYDVNTAIAK